MKTLALTILSAILLTGCSTSGTFEDGTAEEWATLYYEVESDYSLLVDDYTLAVDDYVSLVDDYIDLLECLDVEEEKAYLVCGAEDPLKAHQ